MKDVFRIVLIIGFIIFIGTSSYGQKDYHYLEFDTQLGLPINQDDSFYSIYPDNFIFSTDCKSKNSCTKQTPEETLISAFSSLNYEWEQSCYAYKIDEKPQKYELKKQSSPTTNNFRLLRKFDFSFGDEKYCVLKYRILENGKLIPMANVFKKIGKEWKIIMPESSLSKVFVMFNYLSEYALDGIFLQKETKVSYFDRFVINSWKTNQLDLTKCINYTPSDKMTKKEEEIILDIAFTEPRNPIQKKSGVIFSNNKVESKKLAINYVLEIPFQHLNYYVDDDYLNPKMESELTYFENFDFENFEPLMKFKFRYLGDEYAILKYKKNESEILTNVYSNSNNKWNVTNDEQFIVPVVNFILKNDIEQIKKISSVGTTDEVKLEELKSFLKDENNTINVRKFQK